MSVAAPRLLLFPLIRQCKPKTHTSVRICGAPNPQQNRKVHSSRPLRQEAFPQRYGSAHGPQLPPPIQGETSSTPDEAHKTGKLEIVDEAKDTVKQKDASPQRQEDNPASKSTGATDEKSPSEQLRNFTEKKRSGTPLDIVLSVPPPDEQHAEGHRPPHLTPPPYVHHFDTYTLVRDLSKGGFEDEQSVTLMKAVRSMLANNLDVARESLVSKSDTENEIYLFRAACSELRSSLQTSRHSEIQKQRTNRAQLQHEYDILNQRVTQEMLSLREELKGLFNDRKMASGEEKRKLDGKIQQLNYEITVLLNSDSKSEVEGLRWVITRRAAMALAAAACKSSRDNPQSRN